MSTYRRTEHRHNESFSTHPETYIFIHAKGKTDIHSGIFIFHSSEYSTAEYLYRPIDPCVMRFVDKTPKKTNSNTTNNAFTYCI